MTREEINPHIFPQNTGLRRKDFKSFGNPLAKTAEHYEGVGIKFDLLKVELELTQKQMDKYDHLSTTIKTWTVTLWAASLGWSFQIRREEVVLIGVVMVAAFWTIDAVNKNFREGYKRRRDEVALLLQKLFSDSPLPADAVSPDLPKHKMSRAIIRFLEPHVSMLYVSLIVVAIILFLAV